MITYNVDGVKMPKIKKRETTAWIRAVAASYNLKVGEVGYMFVDDEKILETQDTHAGGSGCGCAASTLASYILPKIENGEWKKILFVPTGALMSTVSFNEGASVPGIAHAIMIEHC